MSLSYAAQMTVKINGTKVDDAHAKQLIAASIEQHELMPDAFELRYNDGSRKLLSELHADVGVKVEILVQTSESPTPESLLKGEITSLEADIDTFGNTTIIRGHDMSNRLYRGTGSKTFKDVKIDELVRSAASDAGLDVGTVDAGSVTYPMVLKHNEHWGAFLDKFGKANGLVATVEGGKLNLRKTGRASEAPAGGSTDTADDDPKQFVFGKNLMELHAIVSGHGQVSKVEVRGWDPIKKEAVVSTYNTAAPNVTNSLSATQIAGKLGSPTRSVTSVPVATTAEADAVAKSVMEHLSSSVADFSGVVKGSATIKPGVAISLAKVGDPFDGKYVVTSTVHRWSSHDGYVTEFVISGKRAGSLFALMGTAAETSPDGHPGGNGNRVPGVVTGIVTNVQDDQNLGRVKVKLPWVSDNHETHWARVMFPGAGTERGMFWLPDVEDEVIVAFEHGDPNKPLVIGGIYNGADKPYSPSTHQSGGQVKIRSMKSKKPNRMLFNDDDGTEGIEVSSGDGKYKLVLDKANTDVTIDSDGTVTIHSKKAMTITADDKLTIEGKQGIEMKSGQSVKISGSQVEVSATGELTLKGSSISATGSPINLN